MKTVGSSCLAQAMARPTAASSRARRRAHTMSSTAPEKKELMMPMGEELMLTRQPWFLTPSTSPTPAPALASALCSSHPSTSWPAPACTPPPMRTFCSTRFSLTSRPRRPSLTMSQRDPKHEQRPPWWVSVVHHLEPHLSLFRLGWVRVRACWYARRDSNPHARRHQDLNLGRLPIPPLALCGVHSTDFRPGWQNAATAPVCSYQSTPSAARSRLT